MKRFIATLLCEYGNHYLCTLFNKLKFSYFFEREGDFPLPWQHYAYMDDRVKFGGLNYADQDAANYPYREVIREGKQVKVCNKTGELL